MAVPFTSAAAAYANAAVQGLKPGMKTPAEEGESFGDLLRHAAEESIDTMKLGEQKSIEGIVGKADLADVVTAVSNAEVTLQAVVNVRDRVITAYQEILRMPI
ncbi:flagellar hook-basal body complex protein FliE [Rhodospirillum centenum]|uniref:Flagellar hook-basal body complex protein FliE n=1 Tax=Rhodospirillum centenum (strain ATCC 51521 / SW) TaxID=414684 RepID=B6IS86_RHOCS|nr:flagellar hook-basal body complex protein FliE [Rhodospirillum centenum]ACI98322.1 flagellar hook-basal body complex protein FliE, putative [Rhodospirillum centenum SW]